LGLERGFLIVNKVKVITYLDTSQRGACHKLEQHIKRLEKNQQHMCYHQLVRKQVKIGDLPKQTLSTIYLLTSLYLQGVCNFNTVQKTVKTTPFFLITQQEKKIRTFYFFEKKLNALC
jgi:hypothetical protein